MKNRILLLLFAFVLQFSFSVQAHAQEILIGKLKVDRSIGANDIERVLKLAQLGS